MSILTGLLPRNYGQDKKSPQHSDNYGKSGMSGQALSKLQSQAAGSMGQGVSSENITQDLSDINSKLDALTGTGDGANNTIQTPGGDLTNPPMINSEALQENAMGGDSGSIDGSVLANLRKYKGSCKMKNK